MIKLTGFLELDGAKRGERYARIDCMHPYPHYAMLTIYGAIGRTGDDDLTDDLDELLGREVAVNCWLNEDQFLVTRTTDIAILPPTISTTKHTQGEG